MKAKSALGIGLLLVLLLLASSVQAMSSANYKLEWFTPLTGAGGGPASSTHYAVNLTIGQTAVGRAASAHYRAGLGYWEGLFTGSWTYLPLTMRE
jgi:hypothetical protein